MLRQFEIFACTEMCTGKPSACAISITARSAAIMASMPAAFARCNNASSASNSLSYAMILTVSQACTPHAWHLCVIQGKSSSVKLTAAWERILRRPTPKYTAFAPLASAALNASRPPAGARRIGDGKSGVCKIYLMMLSRRIWTSPA